MDDTLWVSDPAQDRLTALDTAGGVLVARSVRVDFTGWPRKALVRAVVSGGLVAEGDWSYDALASGALPALVPVGVASRAADANRVLDRLDRSGEAFAILDGSGAGLVGRQPFGDTPVLVLDGFGRGFAILHREVADTGPTLRVTVLAATGETLFTRALNPRRVQLTDQAFDSAANDLLARAPRRDASVFRRPRFRPASGQAFFARDGALWVNLARAALRGEQEWAVLEADGSCRGRRPTPAADRRQPPDLLTHASATARARPPFPDLTGR